VEFQRWDTPSFGHPQAVSSAAQEPPNAIFLPDIETVILYAASMKNLVDVAYPIAVRLSSLFAQPNLTEHGPNHRPIRLSN
jgi:hypothetical protein